MIYVEPVTIYNEIMLDMYNTIGIDALLGFVELFGDGLTIENGRVTGYDYEEVEF